MSKKNQMILHCGANDVTRQDVIAVETPKPDGRHYPISHADFCFEARDALVQFGYRIKEERHALAHEGSRYFGLLCLEHSAIDYDLVIGVRNSHDKSYSAGLVAGSRVFVCDNLAFSGTINLARKHTRWINRDLPALMGRMIGRLGNFLNAQDRKIEAYKGHELTEDRARWFAIECVKRGVFPAQSLLPILNEYEKPRHEEFEPRNMWSFTNAVTEIGKQWNVNTLVKRTELLHAVADHVVAA